VSVVHQPLLPHLTMPPLLRAGMAPVLPPTDGRALARSPWRVFSDGDAVELRNPRRRDLRRLPDGTRVCLVVDRPGARLRLRRAARRAGIVLERELIAVPSSRSPVVLVDDHRDSVHAFWHSVLTPPPGLARGWLPATLVICAGRRMPWTWTGAIAPGRVVVGRKR
jgi:hypothetical protein